MGEQEAHAGPGSSGPLLSGALTALRWEGPHSTEEQADKLWHWEGGLQDPHVLYGPFPLQMRPTSTPRKGRSAGPGGRGLESTWPPRAHSLSVTPSGGRSCHGRPLEQPVGEASCTSLLGAFLEVALQPRSSFRMSAAPATSDGGDEKQGSRRTEAVGAPAPSFTAAQHALVSRRRGWKLRPPGRTAGRGRAGVWTWSASRVLSSHVSASPSAPRRPPRSRRLQKLSLSFHSTGRKDFWGGCQSSPDGLSHWLSDGRGGETHRLVAPRTCPDQEEPVTEVHALDRN